MELAEIHPGGTVVEEFIKPMRLTNVRLGDDRRENNENSDFVACFTFPLMVAAQPVTVLPFDKTSCLRPEAAIRWIGSGIRRIESVEGEYRITIVFDLEGRITRRTNQKVGSRPTVTEYTWIAGQLVRFNDTVFTHNSEGWEERNEFFTKKVKFVPHKGNTIAKIETYTRGNVRPVGTTEITVFDNQCREQAYLNTHESVINLNERFKEAEVRRIVSYRDDGWSIEWPESGWRWTYSREGYLVEFLTRGSSGGWARDTYTYAKDSTGRLLQAILFKKTSNPNYESSPVTYTFFYD